MPSLPERIGQAAGSTAARGKWVARGAWLLAAAEIAIAVKDHLDQRLAADDYRRLAEIVRSSKGRPSNLSVRERLELKRIIERIEPTELAKGVAAQASGIVRGRGSH